MSDKIKYINSANYQEAISSQPLCVVDFYSEECPPCEALAEKFEPLSELYGENVAFYKIFRQENRPLAESLGIKGSPTLVFYKNGEQVHETMTGGIKRSQIETVLDSFLPSETVIKIKSNIKTTVTECDVAIIGGGPAGMSAAIYSAQSKFNTILIDGALFGGQVSTTHQVNNYPGFIDAVPGFMLSHYMSEQAKKAGTHFRAAVEITSVDLEKKEILIDGVELIKAKRIIVSTGSSPRKLGIPGENEYRGKGISYCAICDAKYYEGKNVAVIGGGDSAIEEAIFITKFAKSVTIFHRTDTLRAKKGIQEEAHENEKITFKLSHVPKAFVRNSDSSMTIQLQEIHQNKEVSYNFDGVFLFIGMLPNLDLFPNQFKLDELGYIVTDEDMKTNLKDIYAVGDVRSKKYRQISTAVADGTIAAIDISKELK